MNAFIGENGYNSTKNVYLPVKPYKTHKKIVDIQHLKKGWHYGEGEPISKKFINNAIKIDKTAFFNGLSERDIFPGLDGEVRVTIYHDRHYLELTLEPDDTVTYIHEYDDEELENKAGISLNEALEQIVSFSESIKPRELNLWNLSEYLTNVGGTQKGEGFKVWLSEIQAIAVESRLLKRNVLRIKPVATMPFVPTSVNTTLGSQVIPLYSGFFQKKNCPKPW